MLVGATPPPIVVRVQMLPDAGANAGKGLTTADRERMRYLQRKAEAEFAVSGIRFEVQYSEGAFLRKLGYSELPDKFLVAGRINVFVTDSLTYDMDHDRTGGASMGPRPSRPKMIGNRFYQTYIGLREAKETTLPHEYAHHFTLDTQNKPSAPGNFWADPRNDYWLWRQRRGAVIVGFRACAKSQWAST